MQHGWPRLPWFNPRTGSAEDDALILVAETNLHGLLYQGEFTERLAA